MAPSTNIPTARIRPNITMLEIDIPIKASSTKHNRNEVGIAKPTSRAARMPSAANTTIITNAIAVNTEPCSCWTIEFTTRDWSFDVPTSTAAIRPSGHSDDFLATISLTKVAVSIRLNPLRLTTCRAIVSAPLKRAVLSRSSNDRLISAKSPSVTTRSPLVLTGRP